MKANLQKLQARLDVKIYTDGSCEVQETGDPAVLGSFARVCGKAVHSVFLTRTITTPSGVELSLHDALRNAAGYLRDSDGDAYTRAASLLIDNVLANLAAQLEGRS
jgi:ribonuclease HI